MRELDPSIPSSKFRKLAIQLPQRHASLLIQMRTGHIPLNSHLHKICKADSSTSSTCRRGNETVHHYLISCPAYTRQRHALEQRLGRYTRSVPTLLSKPNAFPALFNYVNATRRLSDTFGNVTPRNRTLNTPLCAALRARPT